MNEQQHPKSDEHQTPADTTNPSPANIKTPQTDQQADSDFREAVDQRITDDPQNAGKDDSLSDQPALEEDEDSVVKPKNS